jgi:cobalt-zinc-cadmium efflux system membrane fusion protein
VITLKLPSHRPIPLGLPVLSSWLLAGFVGLLSGCGKAPEPNTAAPVVEPIIQGDALRFPPGHSQLALLAVTAAAPSKAINIDLPAKLVWNEERTQRIYPAFAGRISAINADVGTAIKPGSVLAQLASPDFGMAQADTAKAQVDVQFTQKTLARQKELFDAGIIARKDLEQAQADNARAIAERDRALARTKLYGADVGVNQQLALKSTLTGVVVERNLNPGQELRPDQSGPGVPALFVISDPTSLWVQIDARESEVATLRPGTVFELRIPALPGQKFEGTVTAVADFIDPSTRTIKVRGLVPNPERKLKAEMLASARIERTLGNGVMVPAQAAVLYGNKHRVFVQTEPGVFEPREVTLSYEGPQQVLVSSGLEVGEQVVSENTLLLARQIRAARDAAVIATPTAPAASDATKAVKP